VRSGRSRPTDPRRRRPSGRSGLGRRRRDTRRVASIYATRTVHIGSDCCVHQERRGSNVRESGGNQALAMRYAKADGDRWAAAWLPAALGGGLAAAAGHGVGDAAGDESTRVGDRPLSCFVFTGPAHRSALGLASVRHADLASLRVDAEALRDDVEDDTDQQHGADDAGTARAALMATRSLTIDVGSGDWLCVHRSSLGIPGVDRREARG
jgi:hypothetical protein